MNNLIIPLTEYLGFTENQVITAQKLFQDIFDIYLKQASKETYPIIYHCTNIDNYNSIKNNGLNKDRNYFLEYNNHLMEYLDDEIPGIVCGVNYKDVINRLYPDPEWADLMDIFKKTGNPSYFNKKNIDDKVIYCFWVTDYLKLDLNTNLNINDISKKQMDLMVNNNIFCWLYVKGKVSPELITIQIHPDLL